MSLLVSASTLKPAQATVDVLAIPLYDDLVMGKELPEPLRRRIGAQLRKLEFTCAWGTATLFPVFKGSRAPFIAVLGLGSRDNATNDHAEAMRRGMGHMVHEARKHGLKNLAVSLGNTTSRRTDARGS